MEQRFVPGAMVEHAGRCWRVERPLGPDAVLLRGDDGQVVSADPVRVTFPDQAAPRRGTPWHPLDELRHSEADWRVACQRRDTLQQLAANTHRTMAEVDRVAAELGVRQRRVWQLLREAQSAGADVWTFLPRRPASYARRLPPAVEAVIQHAIGQHYAKASRPSLLSLVRNIDGRCVAAGLAAPSYTAVQARVRARDQAWLTRRREGEKAARSLRLLTGAHPGAEAPWRRVQIDSTPCDIRLVREGDRAVIGRPTVTFALDLYSRVLLGFSVLLEAASTVTVATCLAHACLPKEGWLVRRGLGRLHWPVWGRPAVLEYDQGSENLARGVQRGLRLHGIQGKVRAKGRPEQHGHVERVIGTMMRSVHELPGTTFSNISERGDAEPDRLACLTLPELERVLALAIDGYNHSVHEGVGERPMERYLAYYRRPELADEARIPPRLPEERLLLDVLPFETRALTRCGVRLFRVDYSSRDMVPLWQRDNGGRVQRVVVYDPRSLAQVWVADEVTGEYIALPYRVPHPDMTLAESEESRRRLQALKAEDRTERRLFDNLAEIRAITAQARSSTARQKAERSRQARQGARESRAALPRPYGRAAQPAAAPSTTGPPAASPCRPGANPAGAIAAAEPFGDVEVL